MLWTWLVRPLRPTPELLLTALLELPLGNGYVIRTEIPLTLSVRGTLSYTVGQVFTNWGTWSAIGATVAGVVGWLYARRRKQSHRRGRRRDRPVMPTHPARSARTTFVTAPARGRSVVPVVSRRTDPPRDPRCGHSPRRKAYDMRMTIRKAVLALAVALLATTAAAGPASAAAGDPGTAASGPIQKSLTSAARSVKVTFVNDTDCTYYNYDAWLYHGIWSIYPPTIPPRATVVWGSESSGLFTGTEGYVRYKPDAYCWYTPPGFTLTWNNPYVGSNSYSETLSGYVGYKLTRSGGSGNNASVTWHLFHGY